MVARWTSEVVKVGHLNVADPGALKLKPHALEKTLAALSIE